MTALGERIAPVVIKRSRRGWLARLAIVLLVIWLGLGFVRAPGIAADAFEASYVPNDRVDATHTVTLPAIPPLVVGQVTGEPYLGNRFWGSDVSQVLLVEPITGWTVSLSGVTPLKEHTP